MATLCAGGVQLRNQVNKRFPTRDKASDGWIGDSAHSARLSDHNPDSKGVVYALDLDENMGLGIFRNGRSARRLANELVEYARSGKPGADRIKYVVYENRLASGSYRASWWKWRPGSWGHEQHIHVSFTTKARYDSRPFPLPIFGY